MLLGGSQTFSISSGTDLKKPAFWTIGFQEIKDTIESKTSKQNAITQMKSKTYNYALEQIRIFRSLATQIKLKINPSRVIMIKSLDQNQRIQKVSTFIEAKLNENPNNLLNEVA